jgi:hypothetical protein
MEVYSMSFICLGCGNYKHDLKNDTYDCILDVAFIPGVHKTCATFVKDAPAPLRCFGCKSVIDGYVKADSRFTPVRMLECVKCGEFHNYYAVPVEKGGI